MGPRGCVVRLGICQSSKNFHKSFTYSYATPMDFLGLVSFISLLSLLACSPGGSPSQPKSAHQKPSRNQSKNVQNGLKLHQSTPFDERNRSRVFSDTHYNFPRDIFDPGAAKKITFILVKIGACDSATARSGRVAGHHVAQGTRCCAQESSAAPLGLHKNMRRICERPRKNGWSTPAAPPSLLRCPLVLLQAFPAPCSLRRTPSARLCGRCSGPGCRRASRGLA